MSGGFEFVPFPAAEPMVGNTVSLEPLSPSHREDLRIAASKDQSIWDYFPIGFNGAGDDFDIWFDASLRRLAAGEHFVLAVRRHIDCAIVGTTRFYDMVPAHRRLAIGSTWYEPAVRGSLVNSEVRLLTMTHAFECWEVNRIELITDPRNLSSRAAMKLLGAKQEGIIRNHMIYSNGRIRDSLLFSVIKEEWPRVKDRLIRRLEGQDLTARSS